MDIIINVAVFLISAVIFTFVGMYIRKKLAFLTERASHVGGKPCKKGERQGRGGTRHRQERKPENP